jgi:CPA2 family monovalent cation:H+ antiporter-2
LVAARLKLPLIVGYLAAGLAIGPVTPGFVADPSVATQLSEIGVSLLMFGVGLHFSIADLWAVRKVAVPGAIIRIVIASIMGAGVAMMWGASFGAGLIFGLCLSVSSTVVLLRALGERDQLESAYGKIAIGWLIVEDLVTVIALVILPSIASVFGGVSVAEEGANVWIVLLTTVLKVSLFAAAMLVFGKRIIPRILGRVARTGSRELFTIGVLGIALGVAFGAQYLFDISPALGAFFAGIIIAESDLSYQAGAETLPMQEAFTVLFFVAAGMLFDPMVLVEQPVLVLIALLIVMVGKTIAAAVLVLLFRHPVATAVAVAASLAQIGEFSFILVGLAVSLEILSETARSTVVAVAILSIALNGLVLRFVPNVDKLLRRNTKVLRLLERPRKGRYVDIAPPTPPELRDHVVMIGFGRVGAVVGEALHSNRIPYAVVEMDRTVIDELRRRNIHAIYGDAARPGILAHANIRLARLLIIATPDNSQAQEIIKYARKVNPDIEICARTHSEDDERIYHDLGVQQIVMGERELGLQMALYSLTASGRTEKDAERTVARIREESGV